MRVLITALAIIHLVFSLSPSDKSRISSHFDGSIDSLKTAYQATVARSILKLSLPDSVCDVVANNVQLEVSDLYFASHLSSMQGCQISLSGIEDFLKAEIAAETASINTMFKCITALVNFKLQVDESLYEKIAEKLKVEDSVMAHSLAYLSTALLPGDAPKDLVESIEDVAHRADTVGKVMSFEGGLMETAMFLKGAVVLSQKAKVAGLSVKMIQKFTNYILSNKDKAEKSDLFYTLVGLDALVNSGSVPTQLLVLDNSAVISKDNKILKVSLVDPLGVPVPGSSAQVVFAKRAGGDSIFSSGPMEGSDGVFEVSATDLLRGAYPTELSFELPSGYLDPDESLVQVKCVLPVEIKEATFKLVNVEDNRVISTDDLSNAPLKVKVDLTSRIIFDFNLWSDDQQQEVTLHQVFVRFINVATKQHVYFIAQADLKRKYSIDLNFRTAASKSFGSIGGDYKIELIVGDATLPQAMVTEVATVTLELPESKEPVPDLSSKAKPDITHVFRQPEKRPPQAISMFFTGLVFLPALVLLVTWIKLGANISKFKLTLSSVGFHGGLLAIIAIYVNFFIGVNMFTTMKQLSIAAVVTFLFGQRLLSSIAADKKEK